MIRRLIILLLIVGCYKNSQESTTNWKCMPDGIDTLTVSDDWYISTTYNYEFFNKEYLLVDTTLFNGSWKTEENCDIAGCEDDYALSLDNLYNLNLAVNAMSQYVDENDMEMILDSMILNMQLPIAWYCEIYIPRSRRVNCVPKKGTCVENND